MGRKREPTAALAARGSWRADRPNEPAALPGVPDCPDWLQGESRDEWNRQVPDLSARKLMSVSYRASLAMFCEAWGTYVQCVKDVAEGGFVYITDKGNEVQRPVVGVMHTAFDRALKLGREFGFSPSSKAGIEVSTEEAPSGKLRFFKPAS